MVLTEHQYANHRLRVKPIPAPSMCLFVLYCICTSICSLESSPLISFPSLPSSQTSNTLIISCRFTDWVMVQDFVPLYVHSESNG